MAASRGRGGCRKGCRGGTLTLTPDPLCLERGSPSTLRFFPFPPSSPFLPLPPPPPCRPQICACLKRRGQSAGRAAQPGGGRYTQQWQPPAAQVTGLLHSLVKGSQGRAGWRGGRFAPARARLGARSRPGGVLASTDRYKDISLHGVT